MKLLKINVLKISSIQLNRYKVKYNPWKSYFDAISDKFWVWREDQRKVRKWLLSVCYLLALWPSRALMPFPKILSCPTCLGQPAQLCRESSTALSTAALCNLLSPQLQTPFGSSGWRSAQTQDQGTTPAGFFPVFLEAAAFPCLFPVLSILMSIPTPPHLSCSLRNGLQNRIQQKHRQTLHLVPN